MNSDLLGPQGNRAAHRSEDPDTPAGVRPRGLVMMYVACAVLLVAAAALDGRVAAVLIHSDGQSPAAEVSDGMAPEQVASRLQQQATELLSPFTTLEDPKLVATDGDFDEVSTETLGKAKNLSLTYAGAGGRELRIFTGQALGAPSVDSECPKQDSLSVISCDVVGQTARSFSVSLVVVAIDRHQTREPVWEEVDWHTLLSADLPSLRLEREVTTYWSDGRTSAARERIYSPSSLTPDAFRVPTKVLAEISEDSQSLIQ